MKKITLVHFLIGSLFFMFIYAFSINTHAFTEFHATLMQDTRHHDIFPFESYEARYKVTWRGVDAGVSIHRLSQMTGHRFYFETVTEPHLGFLPFHSFESTLFTWEKNEIKPYQFQYDIKEGKRRRSGHIQFDWLKQKIISLNPSDPFELELKAHYQDKLTHLFMVRQDLQKNKHLNQPITYTVATGDKTKTYTFESMGTETLDTQMGKLQTIKLKNTTHGDRVTTIWFAKEWRFLPVKFVHSRNGKIITSAEIAQVRGD